MRFSIITPSFRQSEWLRLCVASVADQNVELEHIVQDAGSDDGTLDWLQTDERVKAFVERDSGMYDAVNRGLRRATGDILAYLNCDEQYLPGALAAVREFFQQHPNIDVVFGDFIVVNPQGEYLLHRKVLVPLKYHTWTCHLSAFTCATFFRRKLIDEHRLFFNPEFRIGGDGEWMLRLLEEKIPMAVLRRFTSVFTQTGANMSAQPNARQEGSRLLNTAPFLAQKLRWAFVLQHRLRRLSAGIYFQKPFSYEIYSQDSPDRRRRFDVARPRFRWKEHGMREA